MLKSRKVRILFTALILCLAMAVLRLDASAATKKEYFDSLSVGISQIVDPTVESVDEKAIEELTQISEASAQQKKEESDLVMVNVQVAMNVRAEASEEADKVGVLYKDCGGRILERKDGWTRMKSGDLIGWASDEYLLFGEEAEAMANDVGNLIVMIETDTLCIRKEPDGEAEVFGLLAGDDELEMIEFVNDDWISVDYDGETGYVSAEFVDVDFHIDAGETLAAIREREGGAAGEIKGESGCGRSGW